MLDRDGYRPNVGILLLNAHNDVFWGKRVKQHAWQPRRASSRARRRSRRCSANWRRRSACGEHVRILGRTRHGCYEVPENGSAWRAAPQGEADLVSLRLVGRDTDVSLRASERPEFDAWRWHDYWVPLDTVIEFKRDVYRQALTELHRFLNADRRRRPRNEQPVNRTA
jgi:putative (di)nucleoside polyphosphate hydrolase